MSVSETTIEVGGCTIVVSLTADIFTADHTVIDRVRSFVEELRTPVSAAWFVSPSVTYSSQTIDAAREPTLGPAVLVETVDEIDAAMGKLCADALAALRVKPAPANEARATRAQRMQTAAKAKRACQFCEREYSILGLGTHEKHCTGGNKTAKPSPAARPVIVTDTAGEHTTPVAPIHRQPIVDALAPAPGADGDGNECQHCGKVFGWPQARERHEAKCLAELDAAGTIKPAPTFPCANCDGQFETVGRRDYHEKHCSGPVAKAFSPAGGVLRCDDCEYTAPLGWIGLKELTTHVRYKHERDVTAAERTPRAAVS